MIVRLPGGLRQAAAAGLSRYFLPRSRHRGAGGQPGPDDRDRPTSVRQNWGPHAAGGHGPEHLAPSPKQTDSRTWRRASVAADLVAIAIGLAGQGGVSPLRSRLS